MSKLHFCKSEISPIMTYKRIFKYKPLHKNMYKYGLYAYWWIPTIFIKSVNVLLHDKYATCLVS